MQTDFLIGGFTALYLIYNAWCHPETNERRKDGVGERREEEEELLLDDIRELGCTGGVT